MDGEWMPDVEANNDNRSAQVIQIDSSKHVAAITMCAIICGISLLGCVVFGAVTWNLTIEYSVVKNRQMHMQAELDVMKENERALRSQ